MSVSPSVAHRNFMRRMLGQPGSTACPAATRPDDEAPSRGGLAEPLPDDRDGVHAPEPDPPAGVEPAEASPVVGEGETVAAAPRDALEARQEPAAGLPDARAPEPESAHEAAELGTGDGEEAGALAPTGRAGAGRPQRRHDWLAIRREYVEGVPRNGKRYMPTLDEVAAWHEVNAGNVRRRAARENWRDARSFLAAKVAQERAQGRAFMLPDDLAVDASLFDANAARAAGMALAYIAAEVKEMESSVGKGFDVRRLRTLIECGRVAQAVGRLALGEPMHIGETRSKREIDYSKMSTDELRVFGWLLERADGDANSASTRSVGVVESLREMIVYLEGPPRGVRLVK